MAKTPSQPSFEPPLDDAAAPGRPALSSGASPIEPGKGWKQGGRHDDEASTRPSAKLPWVLTAMLAALSLVLGTMLAMQSSELRQLRDSAASPAPSGSAQPGGAASVAPPSQNPEAVAAMKKLPRRQAGDPTAKGAVDAPVVMITWSDFRCPFCSVWARDTEPRLQAYVDSGSLRIEHRDLVLFGDESMAAAMAARAAGNQGRFWQFYDAVHAKAPTSGHPTIRQADLLAFAKTAGVPDMARFTREMASPQVRAAVEKDSAEARALGLGGTPFFVVNTTPLSGAQPLQVFEQVLQANGAHK